MPAVSVPCPAYRAPVHLGDEACRACDAPVLPRLRETLLSRLEAMDADYRDAHERTRRTGTVMLLVALSYLALATFSLLFHLRTADGAEPGVALFVLASRFGLGLALFACYVVARLFPMAGIGAACALWLGAQLALGATTPESLLLSFTSATGVAALFAKIIVTVLLLRGLLAARTAAGILARARSPHPEVDAPQRSGGS